MAIKPIPRKRRRDKDLWKAHVISFVAAALCYLLPRMALLFLAAVVITLIGCLISGDFSRFFRTVGAEALFVLLMWAVLCTIMAIRTAIAKKASGSKKYHPAHGGERVDKTDRNISRKRIAKQKTLARKAAGRKKQEK